MKRFAARCPSLMMVALMALAPSPAQAQATLASQFFVSHTLGNLPSVDPLVDPNTFFVIGAGQSKDLPLAVRSVNFSGQVKLIPYCYVLGPVQCATLEVLPDRLTLTGDGYEPKGTEEYQAWNRELSVPKEAWLEAGTYARPVLRVTAPSPLTPGDTGNFLGSIEGSELLPFVSYMRTRTFVIFSVLDIVADNQAPLCATQMPFTSRSLDVLPLAALTRTLFDLKAANPSKTKFSVGIGAPSGIQKPAIGWQLDIEKAPMPLGPDEALIVLDNPTQDTQSLWTYTSNACSGGATYNMVVPSGDTQEIRISKSDSTTIVLSRPYEDLAVFAEPNFWTLFGGRKVTLTVVD